MARRQLLELGYSSRAIQHRIAKGRLHRVWRGSYAIGRPSLTLYGRWMAAVLSCGPDAYLSHASAAALWKMGSSLPRCIDVSVIGVGTRHRPGIIIHRRPTLDRDEVTECDAIPVTTPICTLIDLAAVLDPGALGTAIDEADKRDLVNPEELGAALDVMRPRPGFRAMRDTLTKPTFTLTDSVLERLFLSIVSRAGLPPPLTQCWVTGFRADFYWPDLGLVVETDGLRYHRTPTQQAKDRRRDQAHARVGLTTLRFTYAQVRFEPREVEATLSVVTNRLQRRPNVLSPFGG